MIFSDINDLLKNYQPTNNPEQDNKVKNLLSMCEHINYRLQTENGELIEKILKMEQRDASFYVPMQDIKEIADRYLQNRYNV